MEIEVSNICYIYIYIYIVFGVDPNKKKKCLDNYSVWTINLTDSESEWWDAVLMEFFTFRT